MVCQDRLDEVNHAAHVSIRLEEAVTFAEADEADGVLRTVNDKSLAICACGFLLA